MEELKPMLEEANRLYELADHLAFSTYPIVGEVKLLMAATEDLYKSMNKALEALLYYERLYKRIHAPKGNFESELMLLKEGCMRRYGIDQGIILLMRDLKYLLEARKASPIEFARSDKLVICGPAYSRMDIVNIKKLKGFMHEGKIFLDKVNQIVRVK